ncbi:MAG: hypothetical protein NT170_04340 [Candidatus Moranbacteria bacterium]|nr:hypothetical protein [Candidatus Moranbacteria bacterium]
MKFIENKQNKKFTRRDLLIGFCAALILVVSLIFPQTAYGETFWLSFFLFTIFPAITIIFILKEPLKNFGLSLGQKRPGIIFSATAIAIFIFINYFLLFHSKYGGQLSRRSSSSAVFPGKLDFDFAGFFLISRRRDHCASKPVNSIFRFVFVDNFSQLGYNDNKNSPSGG